MASREKRRRKERVEHGRAARDAGEGAVSAEEDFMALGNDARWDLLFSNSIKSDFQFEPKKRSRPHGKAKEKVSID